jgi:hypothetical protein
MADATSAPGVKAGAGEPILPGDAALTGSGAPASDTLPEGAIPPPADEAGAEVEAEEEYVREEPKTVNAGVVQDNVTEPGVQRTTQADGSESVHHTGGVDPEAEDDAEVDDEAE